MKKNIMKAAFVAVIAMVSGINVFNAQKSETLSDTALANVEALADIEIISGNTGPSELYDCPLWFTGDGTRCLSANQYPCTSITCNN